MTESALICAYYRAQACSHRETVAKARAGRRALPLLEFAEYDLELRRQFSTPSDAFRFSLEIDRNEPEIG